LQEFQAQLADSERIVAQNTVEAYGVTKLIITTEEVHDKNRNLLIEDMKKRNRRDK
jgi:hypothetical protein